MNKLLKHPWTNAACLSLFSVFYAVVFFMTAADPQFAAQVYPTQNGGGLWAGWGALLAGGHHIYIAYALLAMTVVVIVLLIIRRRPYDEYHTALLLHCLVAALMLTLVAIAVLFLLVLHNPVDAAAKFMLFIVIHWATIVAADLWYVLRCGQR